MKFSCIKLFMCTGKSLCHAQTELGRVFAHWLDEVECPGAVNSFCSLSRMKRRGLQEDLNIFQQNNMGHFYKNLPLVFASSWVILSVLQWVFPPQLRYILKHHFPMSTFLFIWFSSTIFQLHQVIHCFPWLLLGLCCWRKQSLFHWSDTHWNDFSTNAWGNFGRVSDSHPGERTSLVLSKHNLPLTMCFLGPQDLPLASSS